MDVCGTQNVFFLSIYVFKGSDRVASAGTCIRAVCIRCLCRHFAPELRCGSLSAASRRCVVRICKGRALTADSFGICEGRAPAANSFPFVVNRLFGRLMHVFWLDDFVLT